MFKLHAVQAQFGDCLILEFGARGKERYLLIDGGPRHTFDRCLNESLSAIVTNAKLEIVILSHIDADHIVGLLDLFAALEQDLANGEKPRIKAGALWHNSFQKTIDPTGAFAQRIHLLMTVAGTAKHAMPLTADAFFGVKEGNYLRILSKKLNVPINEGFEDDLILLDTAPALIALGELKLRVVGPSRQRLAALQKEWMKWLAKTEKHLGEPEFMANADMSVPNLSSIIVLAEFRKKTVLLTGDARGDHILDGLTAAGCLKNGKLHVDVMKVPHHGSSRNVTPGFFESLTANRYLISADGTYGNPDFDTLKWIVEAAHSAARPIEIVATNLTPSLAKIQETHEPDAFGYQVRIRSGEAKNIEIDIE